MEKRGQPPARVRCMCVCVSEYLCNTSYMMPQKWQTIKMRIIALSHNKRCVNLKVIIYRYELHSLFLSLDVVLLASCTQILALSFPFFLLFHIRVRTSYSSLIHTHTHSLYFYSTKATLSYFSFSFCVWLMFCLVASLFVCCGGRK